MFCFQCFEIFFDLFHIFFQEHQAEADGQQQAGEPDGLCAAEIQRQAAQARAQRKQEDDAPVIEGFFRAAGLRLSTQLQRESMPLRMLPMHMVLAKA